MVKYLRGFVMKWFEFILRKYLKNEEDNEEIVRIFKNFNYFVIKFKETFNNPDEKRIMER